MYVGTVELSPGCGSEVAAMTAPPREWLSCPICGVRVAMSPHDPPTAAPAQPAEPPAPDIWKAAYEDEALKFQNETRHSSLLARAINTLLQAIYDTGGEIGPTHPAVLAANRAVNEPVNTPPAEPCRASVDVVQTLPVPDGAVPIKCECCRQTHYVMPSESLLRAPVKMSGPFTDAQIAKGAAVLASLRHPPTRPHQWTTCQKHDWIAQDPCPVCEDESAPAEPPATDDLVRRFACFTQEDGVYESPTGEHVAYADYAALRAENERQAREIESLRAECGLRQIRGYNDGKEAASARLYEAEAEQLTRNMRQRAERAEAERDALREVVKAADAAIPVLAAYLSDDRDSECDMVQDNYSAARAKVKG